jgi:hypothetical protein
MSDEEAKTEGSTLAVVGEGDKESEATEYAEERRIVLSLRDKADDTIWDLAVALADVYEHDKYRAWGYDSWREYVERELDWHIRKGQVMVQLQHWFKTIPPNIQSWIKSLGWGKAKILQRVVTAENAAEWRAKIEGKTLSEIEEMLKEGRDTGGGGGGGDSEPDPNVTSTLSFKLYPDQRKTVDLAIEKAKDMSESDKPGHCLDLIATEFLSTHAGMLDMKEYLKHVEKIVGYSLIVYDRNANDIVYGGETLDFLNAKYGDGEDDEEEGDEIAEAGLDEEEAPEA